MQLLSMLVLVLVLCCSAVLPTSQVSMSVCASQREGTSSGPEGAQL